MSGRLSFHLLGALEVRAGDQRVVIGGPRQRTVLAMLLLAADRVVSVDSLVESMWNGRPPATGRTQVAICVAGLRKTFKAAGCAEDVIVTASPGYMLVTGRHRIDAAEFTSQALRAHEAEQAGDLTQAADLLGAALNLWRGPALAGVSGYAVEIEAARLEEQRLTAVEMRSALRLELGQHRRLISELAAVVRQHPLREQARAHLMTAQYRAGRRAEALETFREGRERSIEEIGMEPGPALQRLQDLILRDDPTLMGCAATASRYSSPVVPAQLPPDVPGFLGRDAELSALHELLDQSPATGFVTGAAGVGKTGLALHWAHQVADRFPDGQLFTDLHGYDREGEPTDPSSALASFLRALGVPDAQIPAELHDRAALYRSILDGRRVLIILDNARSFAQVLPLLPGNGNCCLVVTGRRPLAELLGSHGATMVHLSALASQDAVALLDSVVGDDRITEDPEGADRLVRLCDRLPLALRIAAAKLATKPHWTVGHLVRRMEDNGCRLDEFDGASQDLRGSFEPSYRDLSPDAARLYRRLGLLDAPDFPAWVGAALLDTSLAEAERLIEQLIDAQLVEVSASGGENLRYRLNDLLRLHAREHAWLEEARVHGSVV
ncbi:DNA-binding SARP family transcriptional activator [Kutzneria viridogrisea]|uniref:DNA-binding SARP family transcriptional activator n=1 Tax=Kutzneria viridogrisea TaxID=47990 RepID=A0ABR6BD79_9PSEU|nr:DNA-binding SARP family transcriptional activator [Kutzneria viridogrisea]